MIKMRLRGRLGNQLFIYAFARCLNEKYNQKVLIYDRKHEKEDAWHSHLDGYKLHTDISFTSNKKEILRMGLGRKFLYVIDKILIRTMSAEKKRKFQLRKMRFYVRHGLLMCMDGYFDLPLNIPEQLYCDGYFQCPVFFDFIRESILKELVPKEEHTDIEKKLINQINNSNSVCITIRLGDYLNNSVHQVCTANYYKAAMRRMKELQPDCCFFVFSDEVDKAREIFDFEYPVIFDAGKSKDYMSLDVMSKCKHFIISNSSFSWWAQYLSQNPDKIVISPSKWYAENVPCDIMQKDWILLDC